ncbi:MAG: hypothetical protein KF764_34495 [Labilithrix sp.]|nr:hypothetical protein [Labilithrix sp.]
MPDELPPKIANAKTLLLESMRLLHLHGTMRVRRRDDHRGRAYVFTVTIPVADGTSVRDLKRESLRQRG